MNSHNILEEHPEIVHYLQNLIIYFLERQRLVALAILDVAPLLLQTNYLDLVQIDIEPYIEWFEEKQASAQSPQELYQGTWKNSWNWWVHGKGCKLTNIATGEPLEWDAPNLQAFRFDWFWQHLVWRSEQETSDPYVKKIAPWLRSLNENEIKQFLLNESKITVQSDGSCVIRIAR